MSVLLSRFLQNVNFIEKNALVDILRKLHSSLTKYEESVVSLQKSGSLKRFLTNNRLRNQLEKLNTELHGHIESFVEIALQAEVKSEEYEVSF